MKNQIGLEAEFLLKTDKGELVYPGDYGFCTDEFVILGEFRGKPGETREETIGNFIKEYYSVIYRAQKQKLTVDISRGWEQIDPKFYSEILRKMGTKSVAQCKNIYETDILSLSDAEHKGGKIISQKLSLGLHVHFSSENINEIKYKEKVYEPVNLPINLGGAAATFNLFREKDSVEKIVSASVTRITRPVVDFIVKKLDEKILPESVADLPKLKFRNPGFYEMKGWGFEYRSLPFNENVLKNIHNIVDFSFKLLEDI